MTDRSGMTGFGFWREVPCGHPPDPVAIRVRDGLVCHCGWFIEEDGPLLQQCSKCGCHVAKHVPTDAELAAFRASP